MRHRRLTIIGALLGAAWSGEVAAQRSARDGLWLGATLGTAWLRVACAICDSDRGAAPAGAARVGGRVGRGVLVGAEATGWLKSAANVDESLWGFGVVGLWYPSPRKGLYWKAALGALLYRIDDDTDVLSATAFGVGFGAGWDFPLDGRVFISPHAALSVASWGGGLRFNGASTGEDVSLTLVAIGVALTRR